VQLLSEPVPSGTIITTPTFEVAVTTPPPAPRRLAVSGKMASGKDTVAKAAVAQLGLRPVRINLADAIRAELAECFHVADASPHLLDAYLERLDPDGLHPDHLEQLAQVCRSGGDVNRRSTAVRVGLQQLAWLARQQDPDIWIRRHRDAVERATLGDDEVIVTTDVREAPEVLALDAAGFVVVRLEVSSDAQRRRLASRDQLVPDHTLTHPNETALDTPTAAVSRAWAAVIDNDGPLEVAARQLADVLAERWSVDTGAPR
jgi:dephospho-CoA kinase